MGGKSPDPPDYRGAAQEEAQASKELTTAQTWANRPTVNTPWGAMNWQTGAALDPSTGTPVTTWTGNVSLTPAQQEALAAQQRIQSSRSQGAEALLSQALSSFQRPFDWENLPDRAGNVSPANLSTLPTYSGVPNKQSLFGLSPVNMDAQDRLTYSVGRSPINLNAQDRLTYGVDSGTVTSSLGDTGNITRSLGGAGNLVSTVSPGSIAFSLGGTPGEYRDRAESAVWERMQPALQDRRSDVETQLANMGITRGSEAWEREQRSLSDAEDRARLSAIEAGRAEASQLFGQGLQSAEFANRAEGQRFGQGLQTAELANRVEGQRFGQGLQAAQFENLAQGQQFGQAVQRGEFANRAEGQRFSQAMQSAMLGNDTALKALGFENAAQAQEFSQLVQNASMGNDAALRALGFENAAQAQEFSQGMQGMQFENAAQQQEFENLMLLAQRGDQQAQQQLDMQIRAGTFQNLSRQQAVSEETMRRSQILNELNALLTGQQVAMPGFPTFSPAGKSETPQLMNAATNQYEGELDAFNADQASQASIMQGLSTLAMFMASDRRLKRNIQRIGTHPIGVGVYEFDYIWGQHAIGVMADEVAKVLPAAVAIHPSGYLMVDYGRL